jgi:hypothetical protein
MSAEPIALHTTRQRLPARLTGRIALIGPCIRISTSSSLAFSNNADAAAAGVAKSARILVSESASNTLYAAPLRSKPTDMATMRRASWPSMQSAAAVASAAASPMSHEELMHQILSPEAVAIRPPPTLILPIPSRPAAAPPLTCMRRKSPPTSQTDKSATAVVAEEEEEEGSSTSVPGVLANDTIMEGGLAGSFWQRG